MVADPGEEASDMCRFSDEEDFEGVGWGEGWKVLTLIHSAVPKWPPAPVNSIICAFPDEQFFGLVAWPAGRIPQILQCNDRISAGQHC